MVHPIQYQEGGGTTAVEDSGVLRVGGGESDHRESSSTKNNKKRAFANDNKNSSDEPSAATSVLRIYFPKCAAGLYSAELFGSCVTVSTESTDDGFDINLHHGSPKALAYKVLTTNYHAYSIDPHYYGLLYTKKPHRIAINIIPCRESGDGDKFQVVLVEVDAGILSMVEEVFSGGNETRATSRELWNNVLLPTSSCKIIKLLRTASGNTNKRKKRASADGVESNDGGTLINVSREVNDVDMGVDRNEGAGVVGCGIDLLMGALEGSDLASYLTVTDVCNVALVNSKCYQAMEKYTPFVDVKRVIFDVIGSCGLLENDPVPSFSRVSRIYKELEQNKHATLRRLQCLYLSPKLECLDRDINQLIDQSFEERYVALDEDEDVFGLNDDVYGYGREEEEEDWLTTLLNENNGTAAASSPDGEAPYDSDASAWDCDFGCGNQFSDYDDAVTHEASCKYRKDLLADGTGGGSGAAASSAVSSSRTTSSTSSALAPSVPPKQTEAKKQVQASSTFFKADPSSSEVAPKPETKVSSKPTPSTLTKSSVSSSKSTPNASTSGDAIASLLSAMETNPELNTNLSSGTVSFVTEIACKYDVEGMDDVFDEDDDDHITRAARYHIKNPHMKRPALLRDFCKVKDPQKKLIMRLKNKTLKLAPNFKMDNKQAKANRASAKSGQTTKKRNHSEGASSRKRSAEIITGIGK